MVMSSGEERRRPATEQRLRGIQRSIDGTREDFFVVSSEQGFGPDGPTIASLPSGVLSHIFDDLGPRDLASASCVCKAWRRLVALEAAANQVWRSFYSARWQLSGARWPPRPTSHAATTINSSDHVSSSSSSGNQGACVSAGSSTIRSSNPITVPGSAVPSQCGSASSAFYSSSSTTPAGSPEMRWQWAYGTKMLRLRSWSGRYSSDQVVGHKMAVRAVRLLPACDLMATASLDRTVRLWDLRSGLPLGHSRSHGGTVRCLALDTGLLASGSSDSLVRIWQSRAMERAAATGAPPMPLFNISSKPYILHGHGGPVSCLALDEPLAAAEGYGSGAGGVYGGTLFSGSWDCTVRIWRQGRGGGSSGGGSGDDEAGVFSDSSGSGGDGGGGNLHRAGAAVLEREDGGWSCAGVLQYSDWVYCCAVRGGNLLVAAGSEVVVTDAATGRAVRRFADLHDGGAVACLEGCRSGRLLFTASGDGLLLAHDLRMKQGSRVLWHHNAAVTGLAFEDPWLASSSADGCIILQDSEQALVGGGSPQRALNASCRALHCPTGQPALCLDLADQWLAAGTESGMVRMWDFTGAAAAAERAAASRAARSTAKANRAAARQLRQQQQLQQHFPPMPYPQQHRQQRGRQNYFAADLRPQYQQYQQQLAEVQDGHEARHPPTVAWPAEVPVPAPPQQQQQPRGKKSGRVAEPQGGVAADAAPVQAQPSSSAAAASSASRRNGRSSGGGGSSDRWRHGGGQSHRHPYHHHALFPRASAPKPPPAAVAPTFRYVGSGAGGAPSGSMAVVAGAGQQRQPQRPQRQ